MTHIWPTMNLKLIVMFIAHGSYHWITVKGLMPMYGCYVCTSNDAGCISSDSAVLEPYKKACRNNFPAQCAVTLGQKNSAIYNGYPPRPDDEINGDVSYNGSVFQRFCSASTWSSSSFRAGYLVTGRGCSDRDYCNSYLPDMNDDVMDTFTDVKQALSVAAASEAAAGALAQADLTAQVAADIATKLAKDAADKTARSVVENLVAHKAAMDVAEAVRAASANCQEACGDAQFVKLLLLLFVMHYSAFSAFHLAM